MVRWQSICLIKRFSVQPTTTEQITIALVEQEHSPQLPWEEANIKLWRATIVVTHTIKWSNV